MLKWVCFKSVNSAWVWFKNKCDNKNGATLKTHSAYVTVIAYPLQQWLHESTSLLRYTYIVTLYVTRTLPVFCSLIPCSSYPEQTIKIKDTEILQWVLTLSQNSFLYIEWFNATCFLRTRSHHKANMTQNKSLCKSHDTISHQIIQLFHVCSSI
jgi:hypothetical protein